MKKYSSVLVSLAMSGNLSDVDVHCITDCSLLDLATCKPITRWVLSLKEQSHDICFLNNLPPGPGHL